VVRRPLRGDGDACPQLYRRSRVCQRAGYPSRNLPAHAQGADAITFGPRSAGDVARIVDGGGLPVMSVLVGVFGPRGVGPVCAALPAWRAPRMG